MTQRKEFNLRSERIEQLAAKLEQAADPELHATATELLQCVMELHGVGLERIMQALSQSGEASLLTRLLDDNLVSSLLLLHNLHPDELRVRVHGALEKVRPQLEANSCAAEVVDIQQGIVRLRLLHHGGGGCHSTASAVTAALEDAITEAAPDAEQITIETVESPAQPQLITIAQITSEEVSHAAHQAR